MRPGREALEAILRRCGIALPAAQLDRLWAYHGLLRAANAELNLTRIHNFENMVLKHYVDSLLVLKFAELPSPLIDMGSGAGLPGIPLKIARPGVEMVLAEPRGARAEFLKATCDRLGLEGVEVIARKVNARFPRRAAGVITRAVAAIPETLDLVADCLEPGGRMLFMKGPDCDAEVAEARRSRSDDFRLVADHDYSIPGTTHDRRLVIFERLNAINMITIPDYTGPVQDVASPSNPTFKLARDLLTGRGIREHGRALLSGPKPVAEVLERFPQYVESWITGPDGPSPPESVAPLHWLRLAGPLFRELDTAGTHAPLLMARLPEMPAWSAEAPWPDGCTLFLPFQDPENVGAALRSAAAFGVARVVLLREAAHPFLPKAARAAGTALFQVPLWTGPSLRDLDASTVPLIALATDGPALADEPFPDRFGLVPGLEGPGLPDHLRDGPRRRIPIAPGVESLNAAVATAVALYEWRRSIS
ncbi:MAG TPA: 16S rRNA (guanine(527)-N(7))-methyltransferase RsmG [Isosphaeraceae bacterium]|jgi:16S rRNA (guanine527-N7)-methyltransferase|nr:16S rRNA (guanine(527)-N(7))-methyltransferase RsmG [Isosphaeraceae bacterium]